MARKEKPVVRGTAHQALIDREQTIASAHPQSVDAALEAIAADRRARWQTLLAGREESAEIRGWAGNMAVVYGPRVQVWRSRLDWITALYVVRYGEAEDFWPQQLTSDDHRRALTWFRGVMPDGVHYLAGGDA